MNKNAIVNEYQKKKSIFEVFTFKIETLIGELLKEKSIRYHLIESRTKSVESFNEKISRPGKSYKSPLTNIPDISGIRVLAYYGDDVVKVGHIIEKEFKIIEKEISHQSDHYEVDKFGYLSTHYVVSLKQNRYGLSEWKTYKEFHAEIQVRTILQHSWAAISHALQYKKETDVPPLLRRKLYRLAGLFELADEEFMAIRDSHDEIEQSTEEAIEKAEKAIPINRTSIKSLLKSSKRVKELRRSMIDAGFTYSPEMTLEMDRDYVSELVELAEHLQIEYISEIESALLGDYAKYFQSLFVESETEWSFDDDFVIYLVLIKKYNNEIKSRFLTDTAGWDKEIAGRVIIVSLET